MKLGILTFHRALNYGAVWQCWALVNTCRNFGYDTYVIDYAPTGIWKNGYFKGQRIKAGILHKKMRKLT